MASMEPCMVRRMVAHFGQPGLPQILKKYKTFSRQFHNFSTTFYFTGRIILLVGSSFSAEDIAVQSLKAGAEYVTISYRSRPIDTKWPPGIDQRTNLERIDGKTVRWALYYCQYRAGGISAQFLVAKLSQTGFLFHFGTISR